VNDAHAVYCWGVNDKGQLGTGDLDPRSVPTQISGLTADRVVAEFGRACASRGDSLHCWGSGDFGDGQPFRRESAPVAIAGLAGFDELALGSAHGCTLTAGAVHCWGQRQRPARQRRGRLSLRAQTVPDQPLPAAEGV